MSTPAADGGRRSGTRHRGAGRREAPPKNPLFIAAVICAVLLGGVCLVIWVLPAGEPVSASRKASLQSEKNSNEVQIAAARQSVAAADGRISRQDQDLVAVNAKLAPGAGVPVEEVQRLQLRVDELEKELAPQRAQVAALKKQRDQEEGDNKLDTEVLKAVNSCMAKLIDQNGRFVCSTVVRGWFFTPNPRFSAVQIAYGANRNVEDIRYVKTLRQDNPYLLVQRYDRADPTTAAFDQDGFTPKWYETAPKDGMALYCVCHQKVGDTELNNTIVSGVCSGTKEFGGVTFIKTTLPARNEMAGAPVVTADGKLVGIMMPRLPGVEDLSMIMPVAELNRIATGQ